MGEKLMSSTNKKRKSVKVIKNFKEGKGAEVINYYSKGMGAQNHWCNNYYNLFIL